MLIVLFLRFMLLLCMLIVAEQKVALFLNDVYLGQKEQGEVDLSCNLFQHYTQLRILCMLNADFMCVHVSVKGFSFVKYSIISLFVFHLYMFLF